MLGYDIYFKGGDRKFVPSNSLKEAYYRAKIEYPSMEIVGNSRDILNRSNVISMNNVCSCATYDSDSGRYSCEVSGDGCMFLIPDSKACAETYGEGPDAYPDEVCEKCQGYRFVDGKRGCACTWGRCMFEHEFNEQNITLSDGSTLIDNDTKCCGGFRKIE